MAEVIDSGQYPVVYMDSVEFIKRISTKLIPSIKGGHLNPKNDDEREVKRSLFLWEQLNYPNFRINYSLARQFSEVFPVDEFRDIRFPFVSFLIVVEFGPLDKSVPVLIMDSDTGIRVGRYRNNGQVTFGFCSPVSDEEIRLGESADGIAVRIAFNLAIYLESKEPDIHRYKGKRKSKKGGKRRKSRKLLTGVETYIVGANTKVMNKVIQNGSVDNQAVEITDEKIGEKIDRREHGVRGHYRTLRNGKRVWVNAHVRCKSNEKLIRGYE